MEVVDRQINTDIKLTDMALFMCGVCKARFRTLRDLQQHLRDKHHKEAVYNV